jgi:hypothetical protein
MYPEMASGLRVDNQRLLDQGASLQHYFQYRETTPALRTRQQQQVDSLGQAYGVALGAPAPNLAARDEWVRLQDSMQTRFARRWAQQLSAAQTQRLVILVHGYNNDVGQTSWYGKLEQRIRDKFPAEENVHFLQVYWDGRAASGLGILPIWGWAQGTMYPVGLSLRQILSQLAPDLPVYILGHSTGAPLVCTALWNCTSALQDSTSFEGRPGRKYMDMLNLPRYATPRLRHVRVAFLAPAMPARHFEDFNDRTYATGSKRGRQPADRERQDYERFVVGQNHHDKATGKAFFPTGFWGSTRLGVKKDEFCGGGSGPTTYGVAPLLTSRQSQADTYLFDFTRGIKWLGIGHGVADFMEATPTFENFLNAWLTDQPVRGNDLCKVKK